MICLETSYGSRKSLCDKKLAVECCGGFSSIKSYYCCKTVDNELNHVRSSKVRLNPLPTKEKSGYCAGWFNEKITIPRFHLALITSQQLFLSF